MAFLNVLPDTKALSASCSLSNPNIVIGFKTKFVPKNVDGTIFDCTGMSAATLTYNIPTLAAPVNEVGQTLTIDTADATGITVTATPAQAAVFFIDNYPSKAYSLVGFDGTNTSVLGKGNLNCVVTP